MRYIGDSQPFFLDLESILLVSVYASCEGLSPPHFSVYASFSGYEAVLTAEPLPGSHHVGFQYRSAAGSRDATTAKRSAAKAACKDLGLSWNNLLSPQEEFKQELRFKESWLVPGSTPTFGLGWLYRFTWSMLEDFCELNGFAEPLLEVFTYTESNETSKRLLKRICPFSFLVVRVDGHVFISYCNSWGKVRRASGTKLAEIYRDSLEGYILPDVFEYFFSASGNTFFGCWIEKESREVPSSEEETLTGSDLSHNKSTAYRYSIPNFSYTKTQQTEPECEQPDTETLQQTTVNNRKRKLSEEFLLPIAKYYRTTSHPNRILAEECENCLCDHVI